jgi:hypothetical protein
MVEKLRPAAIVETGTYLGTTTEWMAAFQVPVFSCECSEEHFGFARARLGRIPNVTVVLGDSRRVLASLLGGALRGARQQPLLFYLDAHWNADLPLIEEIDLVFNQCPRAIVLIDDFEVPDDPGYGFDSYGPGRALNALYIAAAVRAHGLVSFLPSTPSSAETGMRRGCVVLCKDAALAEALIAMPLLRPPPVWGANGPVANGHAQPHTG